MRNFYIFKVLSWLCFWPLVLPYKDIKWGEFRIKSITIVVCGILFITETSGCSAVPGPAGKDNKANQISTGINTINKEAQPSIEQSKVNVTSTEVPASTAVPVASPGQAVPQPFLGQLKVHFLDVGQADSILIQAPSGKSVLIDAGNNGDANTVTGYLKKQGINKIDVLIGTHPHEDHIGGMDAVINSFNIGNVFMPKVSSTTKTFEDVLTAVKKKGLKINTAAPGTQLDLGEGVKAEILAPNSSGYEDLNDWSAVTKLIYGNTSFLLTGDAEGTSEKEMLARGYDLKADVLKVGHHGSSSSTTAEFLNKVNPKYAVISVGKGNDYGHPHKPTMLKLQEKGISVFRTDQNGTIVVVSDGNNITFNVKPGNYSYSGEGTGATQGLPSVVAQHSVSTPEPQLAQKARDVFYTPSGKSYHFDKNCRTLSRSKTIVEGTLQQAINSGHADPCDVCTF